MLARIAHEALRSDGATIVRVISVVVPIRGEGPPKLEVLGPLAEPGVSDVVVPADGSVPELTLGAWRQAGASVLVSDRPRGARLNEAAASSRGEILLFLHTDTRLPSGWAAAVSRAVDAGAAGGAFHLAFSGDSPYMAFIATVANLRTSVTRVPYGDQAPFVRRDLFERLGGFAPWPLLDDVDFGRRLRREGPIALLRPPVTTSPRRYLERGITRTVLKNWSILLRWRLGASPSDLAEEYRDRRPLA
jgi:rSAM/selenodomain-associated transferase 2